MLWPTDSGDSKITSDSGAAPSTTTTVQQLLHIGMWTGNEKTDDSANQTIGPLLKSSILPSSSLINLTEELSHEIEQQLSRNWIDDRWLQATLISVYWAMTLIAICSNSSILLVVACRRRLWTPSVLLSSNLLLASLASALLCMPFTLQSLISRRWTLGWLCCKMLPFLQSVCVFVSSFTVVSISADRYLRITWLRRTANYHQPSILSPAASMASDSKGCSHSHNTRQTTEKLNKSSTCLSNQPTSVNHQHTSRNSIFTKHSPTRSYSFENQSNDFKIGNNKENSNSVCSTTRSKTTGRFINPARSVQTQLLNTIIIWVIAVIFSLPVLRYQELTTVGVVHVYIYNACLERWPDNVRVLYTVGTFLCAFAFPICALCFFHLEIRKYLNENLLSAHIVPLSGRTRASGKRRTSRVSGVLSKQLFCDRSRTQAQQHPLTVKNSNPSNLHITTNMTTNNQISGNKNLLSFIELNSQPAQMTKTAPSSSSNPVTSWSNQLSRPIELSPSVTVSFWPAERPISVDSATVNAGHISPDRCSSRFLSNRMTCIEMEPIEKNASSGSLCISLLDASVTESRNLGSGEQVSLPTMFSNRCALLGHHHCNEGQLNNIFIRQIVTASKNYIRRSSAFPAMHSPCEANNNQFKSHATLPTDCNNNFSVSSSCNNSSTYIVTETDSTRNAIRGTTGISSQDQPVLSLHLLSNNRILRRSLSDSLLNDLRRPEQEFNNKTSKLTCATGCCRQQCIATTNSCQDYSRATGGSLPTDPLQSNTSSTCGHNKKTDNHNGPNERLFSTRFTGFVTRLRRMQKLHCELRRTSKVTLVLILAIVVFAISWLPLSLYNLYLDLHHVQIKLSVQMMYVIFFFCHLLAMSSTISNAVLYGFLNTNIQKELVQVISSGKRWMCERLSFTNKRPTTALSAHAQLLSGLRYASRNSSK